MASTENDPVNPRDSAHTIHRTEQATTATTTEDHRRPISAEVQCSFPRISSLQLSEDGSRGLYVVSSPYKKHNQEYSTSAIWIVNLTVQPSKPRRFTSGEFNDSAPIFHPDGKRVLFLSNRHSKGAEKLIHEMSLEGGDATCLQDTKSKKGVQKFLVTSDGKSIIFSKIPEPAEEEEKAEREKDDAVDHDAPRQTSLAKLFRYDFIDKSTHVIPTSTSRHVFDFSISPTSETVAILTSLTSDLNETITTPLLTLVNLQTLKAVLNEPLNAGRLMGSSIGWADGEKKIYVTEKFVGDYYSDSPGIFELDLTQPTSSPQFRKYIYSGETTDAARILQVSKDQVIVDNQVDLETTLDVIDKTGHRFQLYGTHEDAIDDYDVKYSKESDTWAILTLKSSLARSEPPEVYFGTTKSSSLASLTLQPISDHYKDLKPYLETITAKSHEWTSRDGTTVQGLLVYPKHHDFKEKKLPTILNPHGGPYHRDTWTVSRMTNSSWAILLATHGYLVLLPNYRGSAGRGSDFARDAHHGMGKHDWDDCITMVESAIMAGLADEHRLGLGGWSQGGFMTDWGVTQTNIFKGCIAGAGVSDWNSMVGLGDMMTFELDLGGTTPWEPKLGMGSAIEYANKVETPLLLIHGEEDRRVPFIQAMSFYRAIKVVGKKPALVRLVSYPREGHGFKEFSHALDCTRRVLKFFDTWVKVGPQ